MAGVRQVADRSGLSGTFYPVLFMGMRVMAIALGGVALVATASAGTAPSRLYTATATEACLKSLPSAIAGLPPATPPSPAAPFVYRLPPNRFLSPVRAQLGAWYGQQHGAYAGVILSFFNNTRAAQRYLKSLLSRADQVRNVVFDWGYASGRQASWRATVRRCLRVEPPADGAPSPKGATPRASLGTFAGSWGGHTRRLQISSEGRGLEITDDGCCYRVYRVAFQALSVSGTLTSASAVYRVTSFTRYDRAFPRLRTGQLGRLRLENGIVTNTLTKVFFCSDPAWWATGACGA